MENRLVVVRGEGVRGVAEGEAGGSRCKLLYVEWINSKVLLYRMGNYNIFNVGVLSHFSCV